MLAHQSHYHFSLNFIGFWLSFIKFYGLFNENRSLKLYGFLKKEVIIARKSKLDNRI